MTGDRGRAGGHLGLGPGAEFDRIRAIAAALGPAAARLGDDCALIADPCGTLALSTDVSVEGVHFRREWLTPEEIGWRAAAAALSDLAAEGAETVGLLAAVSVPADAPAADIVALMRGVGDAAVSAGGVVLGGDLSTAPVWSAAVTVVGRAERPVTRAGARPGDRVWVTGALGAARAALDAWRRGGEPAPDARRAFAHPEPRIAAGRKLAALGARAMLDLSDGLGGDAAHLAAASRVALAIDLGLVPVAPAAVAEAHRCGLAPARYAAEGGEDYELLVVLPPEFGDRSAPDLQQACGVPVTLIGWVHDGSGVRFSSRGAEVALSGFDHFR
ncbi:MAG TPA: thiamine-phosphate kinase [Gemmatimonadales bacterium]|nr:thiamine-phosphate kinase [Gemmatimonadales bacterium]